MTSYQRTNTLDQLYLYEDRPKVSNQSSKRKLKTEHQGQVETVPHKREKLEHDESFKLDLPQHLLDKPLRIPPPSRKVKKQIYLETKWCLTHKYRRKADVGLIRCEKYSLQAAKPDFNSRKFRPSQQIIRLVLYHIIAHKFKVCQLDIDLESTGVKLSDTRWETLIDDPKVPIDQRADLMMKVLDYPILGMTGAERMFHTRFSRFFQKLRFREHRTAKGLWVYAPQRETTVIVMIDGDDIIACGKTDDDLKWIVSVLERKYRLTNLGLPLKFAGNWILIDFESERVDITCGLGEEFVSMITNKYHDVTVNSVLADDFLDQWYKHGSTQKLDPDEEQLKTAYFQELIAELMRVAKSARPDITWAAAMLGSLKHSINDFLIEAAERVMLYVATHPDNGITLQYDAETQPEMNAEYLITVTDNNNPHVSVSKPYVSVSCTTERHGKIDWWVMISHDRQLDLTGFTQKMQHRADVNLKFNYEIENFIRTGRFGVNDTHVKAKGGIIRDGCYTQLPSSGLES